MTVTPNETEPTALPPHPVQRVFWGIQNRILSGLLLAAPIALTIWIIYWLYITLESLFLDPLARFVASRGLGGRVRDEIPFWYDRVVAPLIAFSSVMVFLYLLGWLVRSRLVQLIDWLFLKVPGVALIYQVVSNLIQSFEVSRQANRFKRVVLVTYPHPGLRSIGMVTNSLRDRQTGRTILCVCVLTGVFPPTGFTLFVPEEDVTDLDWTMNQAIQAIVTGGLTAPSSITYFPPGSPTTPSPTDALRPPPPSVSTTE